LPAVRYALELGLEQNAEVMIYHVLSEDGDWFGKDTRLDPASALYGGKTNYCTISLPRILPISSAELTLSEAVEPGIPYRNVVAVAQHRLQAPALNGSVTD
jgi:hypothetical protein